MHSAILWMTSCPVPPQGKPRPELRPTSPTSPIAQPLSGQSQGYGFTLRASIRLPSPQQLAAGVAAESQLANAAGAADAG